MAQDHSGLLVVGGFGVDINVSLHSGQWPLDERADTVFTRVGDPSVGHAGAGVAFQAKSLGWDVTAADVLGRDDLGDFIRHQLEARGIGLREAFDPNGTKRSVNLVRPGGGRLSLHDPRQLYDWAPGPELWQEPLAAARWVHVVIVNWARAALSAAVSTGVPVSTDLQDWDGQAEHHRDFAYGADYVFCSSVNLQDPAGLARSVLHHGRARFVVITSGERGATIYPRDGSPMSVEPTALAGRSVVDTNGAGDAFCATFMDATLRGADLASAGRRASCAAAYACGGEGTNTELATGKQLDELLGSRGF